MIDLENIEKDIINKYYKTLVRKNISNLFTNKFIKKPYLENYIIELSLVLDKNILHEKIIEYIELDIIKNEDLIQYLNNNIELLNEDKRKISIFIFKTNIYDNNHLNELSTQIIFYQIEYFKCYNIIIELLFNNDEENNELYNFIRIYIKNKKDEIKKYINKNIKFKIFYYYLNNLYSLYNNLIYKLIECNLFEKTNDKNILNLFLKNLFIKWYDIYKKDIIENKINEKIDKHCLNKSIISRILCLPNIYSS